MSLNNIPALNRRSSFSRSPSPNRARPINEAERIRVIDQIFEENKNKSDKILHYKLSEYTFNIPKENRVFQITDKSDQAIANILIQKHNYGLEELNFLKNDIQNDTRIISKRYLNPSEKERRLRIVNCAIDIANNSQS